MLQLFVILFSITVCIGTRYGWTYHITSINDPTYALNVAWILELVFTPTVSAVKASILVFYLRLSSKSAFRQAVYGGLGFVLLWFIAFEVVIAMVSNLSN
jgi:hypothetical protein